MFLPPPLPQSRHVLRYLQYKPRLKEVSVCSVAMCTAISCLVRFLKPSRPTDTQTHMLKHPSDLLLVVCLATDELVVLDMAGLSYL